MTSLRKILFWFHLTAGLVAGAIIFVMSFTGAVLAFQDELIAWAERDVRTVRPPDGVQALSLDRIWTDFAAAHPDESCTGIVLPADARAAIALQVGRETTYYANPYTGAVGRPTSTAAAEFMRTMVAWHRWLGRTGDGREVGKAITGAGNAAFLVLALTGLYLWWPRHWRLAALKPSLWFTGARGKARDWNWHNVFGFWMLLPIAVMSASGVVLSYRWAGDLVYRAMGEAPPARRGPPGPATPAAGVVAGVANPGVPRPTTPTSPATGSPVRSPADAVPLAPLFAAAAADQPGWTSLTLHLPVRDSATMTAKTAGTWPRTATTTLTLDPATAAITGRSSFADQSAGRRLRTWLRFLHTGQALGGGGQFVAGIGCLAGCILVYTGFALSWRRWRTWRTTRRAHPA